MKNYTELFEEFLDMIMIDKEQTLETSKRIVLIMQVKLLKDLIPISQTISMQI